MNKRTEFFYSSDIRLFLSRSLAFTTIVWPLLRTIVAIHAMKPKISILIMASTRGEMGPPKKEKMFREDMILTTPNK